MKRTGAWLAVRALEALGIRHTMGIPGVHVTELYDELERSPHLKPVLVTHEGGGAFMADAISRTSDTVGTLVVVPGAGVTHALSGIGEAFLDGIPMLVVSGGVRRDTGRAYQLHDIDHQSLMRPITKGTYLVREHRDIVPTLYEAHALAVSGEPGPVFVEIPADLLLMQGEVPDVLPLPAPRSPAPVPDPEAIRRAASMLREARHPGLFLGWGAVDASAEAVRVAELLEAPVATTLQGLSSFPASHPLHGGMGFGPYAVPAARRAFEGCDCLLAVGARFSELGTGSYSLPVPERLIHVDINPAVFGRNFPATLALEGDARAVLAELARALEQPGESAVPRPQGVRRILQEEKARHQAEWTPSPASGRVGPGAFFQELRRLLPDDAVLVADDGNHTFLTAELFPVRHPRRFISPSDFNCMGYAVPAAIGAKLANPQLSVVAVVGDGAFLMTGMELLTASTLGLGVVVCVFRDGELGQIAQFQARPYNRKTCTVLGQVKIEGVAAATGAQYLSMTCDADVAPVLARALEFAREGKPVLVEVAIDYAKPTHFTQGVLKANLARLPMGEKVRFVGRALMRRLVKGR